MFSRSLTHQPVWQMYTAPHVWMAHTVPSWHAMNLFLCPSSHCNCSFQHILNWVTVLLVSPAALTKICPMLYGNVEPHKATWRDVPNSSCCEQTVPVPNRPNLSNGLHTWHKCDICRLAYLSCTGRYTGKVVMPFHYLPFPLFISFFVLLNSFFPVLFSNSLFINTLPLLYFYNFSTFSFNFSPGRDMLQPEGSPSPKFPFWVFSYFFYLRYF